MPEARYTSYMGPGGKARVKKEKEVQNRELSPAPESQSFRASAAQNDGQIIAVTTADILQMVSLISKRTPALKLKRSHLLYIRRGEISLFKHNRWQR